MVTSSHKPRKQGVPGAGPPNKLLPVLAGFTLKPSFRGAMRRGIWCEILPEEPGSTTQDPLATLGVTCPGALLRRGRAGERVYLARPAPPGNKGR